MLLNCIPIRYRLPRDAELKALWIKSIQEANGDNYSGAGLICSQHFSPESIQIVEGNRVKLMENAVPTEFWVDCIDVMEDYDQDVEIQRLNDSITEMKLEFEEKEAKMRNKITELTVIQVQQSAKIENLEKQLQIKKLEKRELEQHLEKEKASAQVKVIFFNFFTFRTAMFFFAQFGACKRNFYRFFIIVFNFYHFFRIKT